MEMVQNFYNLVTDFYEYGWGDCFHFAPRFIGEEFQESLRRTEYFLASKIGLNSTTHALDVGCGVGGPMRNIARFSGSKVTGANISDYQIKVGNKRNKQEHLSDLCTLVKADFMNLPMPDNTFDGAYAIEATCHAPDKVGCFAEVFRTLKPGGLFAGLEWIVTDKYDAKNKKHFAIREGIEVGNGLPVLATAEKVLDSLRKAGFEIVEAYDHERVVHQPGQIPWYESLGGSYTLKGFRRTKLGRSVTQVLVTILEAMRIAPKGTTKVSALLNATADDLYDGGKLEIFTPSYFWLARKPLK
jgi:sterol 24-C-methyltransferase